MTHPADTASGLLDLCQSVEVALAEAVASKGLRAHLDPGFLVFVRGAKVEREVERGVFQVTLPSTSPALARLHSDPKVCELVELAVSCQLRYRVALRWAAGG